MKWILKILAVVILTALLLAFFSPGTIVVFTIVLVEKIVIGWLVLNLLAEIVSGRSILDRINDIFGG